MTKRKPPARKKSSSSPSRAKSSQSNLSLGTILIILIIAALVYFLNLDLNPNLATPTPPVIVGAGDGWYEIYFTDPTCPPEAQRRGGIDETVAADMRQAQLQVDVAAYELNAPPIVDALLELAARGVTVRVVVDSDHADKPAVVQLRNNNIRVEEDGRSAIMHNKFVVIDGRIVWTGAMNLTTNDVHCNNNNFVRFDSPELAANYIEEMNEKYDDGQFGPRSPDTTPNERISINGVVIENYFAPEKSIAPIIAAEINKAQRDIRFMAFAFTHEDIGEAMLERAEAGVNVTGVFETTGSNTAFSYYPPMRDAGLPNLQVRQDGNPRMMHHKVIIIDGQTTIFGSFNFTASANDSNDENIVIVHDPTFASFFVEEFNTVWQEAQR